jgi:hypothetical protein
MSRDRFGTPPPSGYWPSNQPPPLDRTVAKFLRDWKLVKRARFNAAKRFEHKNDASVLAFAVAGLTGFLVPVYTLIFRDDLSMHQRNALEFTSQITGAMSLILGLVEQAKEHSSKSKRFDTCGRQVNSVLRKLARSTPRSEDELNRLVGEYERALEKCEVNHDDIDYDLAKAQQSLEDAPDALSRKKAENQLKRVKQRAWFQTYWLYAIIWIVPPLIGIVLWFR